MTAAARTPRLSTFETPITTTRRVRLWSLRLWSLAAIGSLGASAACAQDGASYFYGGLSVGQSHARIDEERITAGLLGAGLTTTAMSRDERDTATKLFGGYQLNRHLGFEAGYFRLGEFGFTATTAPAGTLTGRIKLQGANLDLVGTWPLTERLAAIGRVGAQYAQTRDTFSVTGAVGVLDPNPRKNEINPKLGIGLQYEVDRSFFVRGEAERYRVNDAVGNHGGVNVFSVSIVFPFGRTAAPAPRVAWAPAPVVVVAPAPIAPVPRRVNFSVDSLFEFDRSEVRPEGRAALDGFVRELRGTRFDHVIVEGYTDRLGTEVYNEGLSDRQRAADAGIVEQHIPPPVARNTQHLPLKTAARRMGRCMARRQRRRYGSASPRPSRMALSRPSIRCASASPSWS